MKIKLATVVALLKSLSSLNLKSDLKMVPAIGAPIRRPKLVKLKHMLILVFTIARSGDSKTSAEGRSEIMAPEKKLYSTQKKVTPSTL